MSVHKYGYGQFTRLQSVPYYVCLAQIIVTAVRAAWHNEIKFVTKLLRLLWTIHGINNCLVSTWQLNRALLWDVPLFYVPAEQWQNIPHTCLGAFAKLRKATTASSCQPVSLHRTTRLSLDGFWLNLIVEIFSTICRKNSNFIKIRQK